MEKNLHVGIQKHQLRADHALAEADFCVNVSVCRYMCVREREKRKQEEGVLVETESKRKIACRSKNQN